MKKIFASFCLLAFAFLTFNVTPAFSREIRTEQISYSALPGVTYTTTKIKDTQPKPLSTGAKVGTAIAATALIGGIVTLGVLAANNDRAYYHDYYYDSHRHHHSHHNPPPPKPIAPHDSHGHHLPHNDMHRPPMPR